MSQIPAVSVRNLGMTYRAPVRDTGLRAALRSVVHREYRDIQAVTELDFDLYPGEVVGFLGRNGAGKTTTLKILSGVLHPTTGEAQVLGHVPWRRRTPTSRRSPLSAAASPSAVRPS